MGWGVAGVVGGERQSGQAAVDDVAFPSTSVTERAPALSQPKPEQQRLCAAEKTKDLSRNNFLSHAFTDNNNLSSGYHIKQGAP